MVTPAELEAKAIKEAVDRILGQRLSELMADLLAEIRRQGARSTGLLNPHSVPVGVNAQLVLEANPRRLEILFFNNQAVSGQQIFLGGRGVTTGPIGNPNAGLPLGPGGSLPFVDQATTGEWWAVSSGGPFDLRILEVLRDAPPPLEGAAGA